MIHMIQELFGQTLRHDSLLSSGRTNVTGASSPEITKILLALESFATIAQAPLVRRISSPALHSVSGLMARVGPTLSPVPLSVILPSLILMRLSQPACNFGHSSSAQLCLPATIMIVETTFDSGTIVGVEPLPGYRGNGGPPPR